MILQEVSARFAANVTTDNLKK